MAVPAGPLLFRSGLISFRNTSPYTKLDRDIYRSERRVFHITSIPGTDRLEDKKVSFVLSRRAMLDSFWYKAKLPSPKFDGAIAELNSKPA
jgi:hypothetical protein